MPFFDKFKKHKVTNEDWEFYQTFDENDEITFVAVDLTYQEIKNQKGFVGELFIRIRMPENKLHKGIPIPEEQQFQNDKDNELCDRLIRERIKCIQVGRLTFEGQKQYIFEYNDLEGFKKVFGEWKASFNKEYSIELNLLKPFEYYSDLLPDKYIWQQIGNRHLIEKLIDAGSIESEIHFIEHGIFGETENLEKLFEEIKEHEIEMIGIEDNLLEVGIKSSIELDDVTNQTNYLMEMSEKYHCKYDGWQTKIVNRTS